MKPEISGQNLLFQRRVGTRARSWVDVKVAGLLVALETVRVPGDQHVNVQLALQNRQNLRVAPGHQLVAVAQADPEVAQLHNFRFGVV